MKNKDSEIKVGLLSAYDLKKSKMFKIIGERAAITDYAMLLGGKSSNKTLTNDDNLKNRIGLWRLYDNGSWLDKRYVRKKFHGGMDFSDRRGGYRPAMEASYVLENGNNQIIDEKGITIVEYGEYPQYIADNNKQLILEDLFQNNKINETNKIYTADSTSVYLLEGDFDPKKIKEYEYEGEKYIRLTNFQPGSDIFSNGEKINTKKAYWIKVEPIKWYVDVEQGFAITKNILFAGIKYAMGNPVMDYGVCFYGEYNFAITNIGKYLNKFFINEIEASDIYIKKLSK